MFNSGSELLSMVYEVAVLLLKIKWIHLGMLKFKSCQYSNSIGLAVDTSGQRCVQFFCSLALSANKKNE